MPNSLSQQTESLPQFSAIEPATIEARLDQLLSLNRQRIADHVAANPEPDATFLQQLEAWDDEINQFWSPVSHLNGVKNSDDLRDAYNRCLPRLTEYATEMGQNKPLYDCYSALANNSAVTDQLSVAEQKSLDNALRDFTLSGIALPEAEQRRYGEIKKRLAELTTTFSNNVLDATHGWSKHLADSEQLAGVPETALQAYQQAAKAKNLDGYLISLDIPAYLPVMQYGENRALREELYIAYNTRASDVGPTAGQWDNSALMAEILALRHELAQLLGFANYAEQSLARKMAESPQQVTAFLNDLAERSLPIAKQDYKELAAFAKNAGLDELQAWDIPFYSEQLRLQKYAVSQEELRAYFPADKVIEGMFAIVGRLFAVEFERISGVDSWHPDVQFFHVLRNGELVAKFYLDIFAREHKRGGAWMADCKVRRRTLDGELQLPVAFLTCNFTAPTEQTPSLLTHNEVTTLFHEFGHGLHHMLTQIECAAVSGINGVAWDAVELPSQFLENWCWEKQAIPLISAHYQTGEALPEELLDKQLAAKNFQSGMIMMRQIEFALFDMLLHWQYDAENPQSIQQVLDEVRSKVAVYSVPSINRFQHGFSHIFAGGYAAGYYSYKWAEVLSADAFSRFEQEGVFNAETGISFVKEILQMGGSREPMELFKNFMGREPSVEALLQHSGIVSQGH